MMIRQHTYGKMLVLVALLIAATVQVNSVFACEMLEVSFVNDCCCGDEGETECVDSSCEHDGSRSTDVCCDISFEVSVSDASDQSLIAISSATQNNVDPPPGIAISPITALEPPLSEGKIILGDKPQVFGSNSKTYLITQRLRI